jgi:RNA polymerase sigma factor (sigma-70 family)
VEASALPASAGLTRNRISLGASLLRLRSDEQLVSLFRAGHDEAFRVIHDRYRHRLFVYTRQMLAGASQDAEDALQDIFVRAYAGLRANDRELALRAWLYRVAHNRCIDELRRPPLTVSEWIDHSAPQAQDPATKAEQRDTLRRLIADVQRLPEQQRSALLMRELGGVTYADMAGVLGVSIPAVKSLLVRARVSLAQASEARETDCSEIREDLIIAYDRGVRPSGLARRHMRDCPACREFRANVRGISRQFAALVPALGPIGLVANFLGLGGGGAAAGSGAAAGGGAAAVGGAAGTSGAIASAGVLAAGAGHVVTLLAAAVVTAGGAVEIQRTIVAPVQHKAPQHHVAAFTSPAATADGAASQSAPSTAGMAAAAPAAAAPTAVQPVVAKHRRGPATPQSTAGSTLGANGSSASSSPTAASESTDLTGTGSTSTATSGTPGSSSTGTDSGGTSTTAGSSTPGGTTATSAPDQTGTSPGTANPTGSASGGTGTGTPTSSGGSGSPSPPPVTVTVSPEPVAGSPGTTGTPEPPPTTQ